MIGATAILGVAALDVVNVTAVNEPTVVYAATTTQKTALRQAKSYYKNMHMSKQGIYDQLTSDAGDKFDDASAQYAVDHVKADWNKNALKAAESYQKDQNMSPEAIRDQLTSDAGDKFTQDQADYAVSHLPQ